MNQGPPPYQQPSYPSPQYPNPQYPSPQYGAGPGAPPPKKSGIPTWLIVTLVVVVGGIFLLGIVGVLAISGVRKYIATAKTAEARNSLAQIGRDAAAAFERQDPTTRRPVHRVCGTASHAIPLTPPRAAKYQSTPAEWNADSATNSGFYCLKFSLEMPQYYSYMYNATNSGTGMDATAMGDLDGDGVFSKFLLTGQVQGNALVINPKLTETNPEE
jgi:type IV pilus assembly protein PilA